MTTPANYWKLGLFVVIGLVFAMIAIVYFGTGTFREKSVDYKTYFDESVLGLAGGSPVRFRGVAVGRVKDIEIGPDHRQVEVVLALHLKDLHRLGLTVQEGPETRFVVPPDLRTQLVTTGLTGVQVLALDFFDPKTNPPPPLRFPAPPRYIPSTPSTLKTLEDAVGNAAGRLPGLIDTTNTLIRAVSELVGQLDELRIGDRANATLGRLDALLTTMKGAIDKLTAANVPEQAGRVLMTLDEALGKLDGLIEHIDGDKGLLNSAQRVTDAVGDVARGARGAGRDMEDTLREVREASAAIKRLADAINRDPDMLVKGRARPRQP